VVAAIFCLCDAFLLSVCAIPPLLALALTLPLLAAGVFAARDRVRKRARGREGERAHETAERERERARVRERESKREKRREI
jgi:hypothetical protein